MHHCFLLPNLTLLNIYVRNEIEELKTEYAEMSIKKEITLISSQFYGFWMNIIISRLLNHLTEISWVLANAGCYFTV
jgi:hypothetical protein